MTFVFVLMQRRPPRSTRTDTLFPYATLVRSRRGRRAARRRRAAGTGPLLVPQGRPNGVVRKLNMAVDSDKIVRTDERVKEKGFSLRGLVIGALAVLVIGLVGGGWAMTRLLADRNRTEQRRVGQESVRTSSIGRKPLK